ncbi:MAG: M17 family metallopeptidase [Steroidobacter sp.]
MELLPAQRDTRLFYQRALLDERIVRKHDALIIVCERAHAAGLIAQLPFAATWRRLYDEARRRGAVTSINARLTDAATSIVIAFVKADASAFDRLTLAARAWKELNAPARARVLLGTLGLDAKESDAVLESLIAAALAATAAMPTLKSKAQTSSEPTSFTLLHEGKRPDFARSVAVDRGNHLARWLTTLPPNVLDTAGYRRALRDLARRERWEFSFLDEAALKRRKAGAFLAVSRANEHRNAGIVRLRYRSANRRKTPIRLALVGKGICFDTGGVNLKTHKGMYHMHEDMQGSAVAVGTLLALSALAAPCDIDCWLAITENQIGARAYRPQEVVRASNGVTIQVAHSDAEGRMVLADTLAIAARETPDLMIDFATLTGSCVVALGDRYSAAFTNRPEWRQALELAGRDSGERVWPFPMDEDYDAELESSIADVLQCTPDSKADHILAARFLNRFVPAEIPWIHLDLAASNRSGGLAHIPTDFTGFGVRYATQLLLDHDLLRERPARQTGKLDADKRADRLTRLTGKPARGR